MKVLLFVLEVKIIFTQEMKNVYSGFLTLLLLGVVFVPAVKAETTPEPSLISYTPTMIEKIQALMTQLTELQKQLATLKGEVKNALKAGLQEGMSDADIKKIQEILATDSAVYPEGKVTGYFGPLTKDAVKRFQTRHQLAVTGVIDEETRDLLEEYLHEGFGGTIPPGLLKAPGIMKKVEDRYRLGCEGRGHGENVLCKKLHENDDDDSEDDSDEDTNDDEDDSTDDSDDGSNDDEDDSEDDSNEDDDSFDVEVEVEDGTTTVSFAFEDEDYEVEVKSTDINVILDAVADAIDEDDDRNDLDRDLRIIIKNAYKEADYAANIAERKAENDASNAIESADEAITEAQEAIDADEGDTTEAKKLLSKAKVALNDAEDAFDDEDFDEAEDLAEDAEELANDAEDAL